jgi:hypothetical protein
MVGRAFRADSRRAIVVALPSTRHEKWRREPRHLASGSHRSVNAITGTSGWVTKAALAERGFADVTSYNNAKAGLIYGRSPDDRFRAAVPPGSTCSRFRRCCVHRLSPVSTPRTYSGPPPTGCRSGGSWAARLGAGQAVIESWHSTFELRRWNSSPPWPKARGPGCSLDR